MNASAGVFHPRVPNLAGHYYRANKLWFGSYFAGFLGGAPLTVLRQYIEQQSRPG